MKNKLYLLYPEVAGQLGEKTILDTSSHPPIVKKLHYKFDGWLGDDIIESFPCFICSENLTHHLKNSNLTGFIFKDCEISKSEQFIDFYPDRDLPLFYWFDVSCDNGNDFFLLPNATLVVSESALKSLSEFNISHCDIEDYNG
jgi:hypothetical protein